MVVKAASSVMNSKVVPARGPHHLCKVQLRERRFIRSMVGVDSRNAGVQAELDPEMTLRNLHDVQQLTLPVSTSDKSVRVSTESSPLPSQSDGPTHSLQAQFDLPSNFATLAINLNEHHVLSSTRMNWDHKP